MHLKKSASPFKVKKIRKKSEFMVLNRRSLLPWNQHIKTVFNQSYGYGAMCENAPNAHALCILAHFCEMLRNSNSDYILFFALIPAASVKYQQS